MTHLAIHDALNAIDRKYQPFAYDKKADPGTSADAAVAAAAYYVMSPTIQKLPAEALPNEGCVRNGIAVVEAAYVLALAVIQDGEAKTQGIARERLRRRQSLRSERVITPMMAARISTRHALRLARPAPINAHRSSPSSPSRNGQTSPPS